MVISNYPDATKTVCPEKAPSSEAASTYDFVHLWLAGERAARKSALDTSTRLIQTCHRVI